MDLPALHGESVKETLTIVLQMLVKRLWMGPRSWGNRADREKKNEETYRK